MKILVFIFLSFISPFIFADSSLPPQKITRIDTGWGSEGIYFSFKDAHQIAGCSGTRVVIPRDHLMLKEILSITLSAFHTGKKVVFRTSGCFGNNIKGVAVAIVY